MGLQTPLTLRAKLIWSALLVFGAGWMFILGIMVGRGTAPIPSMTRTVDDELADIQATLSDQARTKMDQMVAGDEDAPITKLDFYEELKENTPSRPILPEPKPKPSPPPRERQKPAAMVKPAPTPRPAEAAIKPAAKSNTPIANEEYTNSTPNPKRHFSVQVAAVKNAQNAEKLVNELRRKGFEAYQIRSQSKNKGVLFRIRVGAFQQRSEAEATLARLSKNSYDGMIIRTP